MFYPIKGATVPSTWVMFFLFFLVTVFTPVIFAADRGSQIQQAATEWESCIKTALRGAGKSTSKEDALKAAKHNCQEKKKATLSLVPNAERSRMSASMKAALANYLK